MERNKVFLQDCLQGLGEIASNSIDLVATDIPYTLTSGGAHGTQILNGNMNRKNNDNYKNGKMFAYNDIRPNEYFSELFRVLKNGTHFYCMVNDKHLQNVLNEGEKAGFKLVAILVWNKHMHTPTRYYMKNVEFVALFRKGSARVINNLGSKTLLDFKGIKGKQHPSEKPTDLFEHFILNSSSEHDVVLDPFMGSFTTAVACLNTNRQFIGFEIDPAFYKLGQKSLLDWYEHKGVNDNGNQT